MKLTILYEDNHLIVVIKPVGVLSQEDYTQDADMLTLIKQYIKATYAKPGNVFLGLVHRLDRMVGGIMVFAKTSKAASRLSEQVRSRIFEKKYLAVVHGRTAQKATLIDYLYKNPNQNHVIVVSKEEAGAKYSELSFQTLAFNDHFSLIEIDLKTGRPHQIRVQLSHLGYPLYGDKRYGKTQDLGNIALFAYSLSFYHPISKEKLLFTQTPEQFPFDKFSQNL
jgi:23S rRNA pseudouridine1911/1915/1917 synthase